MTREILELAGAALCGGLIAAGAIYLWLAWYLRNSFRL